MERVSPITCQWHQCLMPAQKHAVFGRRVFEAKLALSKSEGAVSVDFHRDVCSRHLIELQGQYVDVDSMEIGSCREHCSESQAA